MHISIDSLTQRGAGTWRVSYHPVFDDGTCGERVYETLKAKTRREARKAAGELRSSREKEFSDEQEPGQACGISLMDWTRRHVAESVAAGCMRKNTADSYLHAVDTCGAIARIDMSAVTVGMAKEAFTAMMEDGRWASNTCVNNFKTARRMMDNAMEEGVVKENPLRRVRLPKRTKTASRALVKEERERISELMERSHGVTKALIALGRFLGVRAEESCGFKWSDRHVDFDGRRQISVKRAITVENGKAIPKEPKTAASARTLPESPELTAILDDWMYHQRMEAERAGVRWTSDFFILGDTIGRPMNPNDLGKRFRAACDSMGLDCTYHWLRHTFATRMIALGVDPRTVARWLGHSDPGFTLRVYCDADEEALAASLDMVSLIV